MHASDHDLPGRILIVDDDPVTGTSSATFSATAAASTSSARPTRPARWQRASSERWDLVLTDVEMPGMTGLELLQALRRAAPGLPVAVITGHASLDNAVGALRGHADEFLQKSVPPGQLLANVSAVVAKGRAARLASRQAVLAIGAHPDDVEIGAAGALLVHRSMGHEVVDPDAQPRAPAAAAEATRAGESRPGARALAPRCSSTT